MVQEPRQSLAFPRQSSAFPRQSLGLPRSDHAPTTPLPGHVFANLCWFGSILIWNYDLIRNHDAHTRYAK